MGIQSTTITTLAVAAALALPSAAAGSPLLSGYGAPGAGEQQLVGAEIVGGGGGHGTGTGSPPQHSETRTQPNNAEVSPGGGTSSGSEGGGPAGSGSKGSGGQTGASPHVKGGQPAGGARGRSHRGERPLEGSGATAAGNLGAASSSTLGLSSAQLLLIAMLAGALTLVALVTQRLARLQDAGAAADRGRMKTGESG